MVNLELIHAHSPDFGRDVFIRLKPMQFLFGEAGYMVIHDNFANRMTLRRRCFIQISALSTFDGSIEDYHGVNG